MQRLRPGCHAQMLCMRGLLAHIDPPKQSQALLQVNPPLQVQMAGEGDASWIRTVWQVTRVLVGESGRTFILT